jgi:hypothetical protein
MNLPNVADLFSDAENFKRMLHNQMVTDDEPRHEWDSELRKKPRGDDVIEEVVVRIRDANIGFVFDAATGRLKKAYTW